MVFLIFYLKKVVEMVLSFRKKSKRNNYYCTCCLYGAGRNDFDAGNISLRGPLEGVGPEMEKGKSECNLGPKKVQIPLSLRLRGIKFRLVSD
jgi:hypothetical protein